MTNRLRLVGTRRETESIVSFLFEPESALYFQAGQYLRYTLPHPNPDARGVARSFTIASAPSEPLLRLTTRFSTLPSTFKQALSSMALGTVVEASGPRQVRLLQHRRARRADSRRDRHHSVPLHSGRPGGQAAAGSDHAIVFQRSPGYPVSRVFRWP